MFSAHEILDMAIQIERNGEQIYRRAAEQLTDESLLSALRWMADEEAEHALWFAELKEALQREAGHDLLAEEFGRELFDGILQDRSFSLEDVDFTRIRHLAALVETFIEFEKDSILFYQVLQSFVQDEETRRKLAAIISEEERHIEKLRSLLDDSAAAAKRSR